jgi:lysophospholipase L1-like esterase
MGKTAFYTKAEADAKNKEIFREIKLTTEAISAGEGGKIYDTLAAAQAVDPKPVNGTVFTVSNITDSENSGVYSFQSGASGGTRYERPLNEVELETGINLFNKNSNSVKSGFYVSYSTGVYSANAGYTVTGKIAIPENTQFLTATYVHQRAFFDINGDYISGINSSDTAKTFAVPSNAKYIDCSLSNSANSADIDNFMIVTGNEIPINYIPFKRRIPADIIEITEDNIKGGINGSKIALNSLDTNKTIFFEASRNIFNIDDIDFIIDKYIDPNGNLLSSTSYNSTGFMFINKKADGDQLWFSASNSGSLNRTVAFYDSEKLFISAIHATNTPINVDIPDGAVFVRTSFGSNIENYQVEVGSGVTEYTPFGDTIKSKYISKEKNEAESLKVFLPKEICIAVGRTIEIYNAQIIWTGNIDNYHFLWEGVGKSMRRKWTCTGLSENIGNYTLSLKIFNKENYLLKTLTTNVKIADATISNPFTVCTIGDSLSNSKPWYAEINALSSNNISFVGTRGNNDHEGRSGASSGYYLGNNSYDFDSSGYAGDDGRAQNLNPFWNPNISDVDFSYYKSNYNQNPDKLIIWLGTNGISVDPTANAGNIKTFIDKIRDTGGDIIPIFVVHTLFRGNQDGLGKQTGSDGYTASASYKLEEDLKVFNLQVELYSLLKDYQNLYLIPVSTSHDSEFNFGAVETPVNPRAAQVEYLPNEATHPQQQGYMQIADIIFSSLAANQ